MAASGEKPKMKTLRDYYVVENRFECLSLKRNNVGESSSESYQNREAILKNIILVICNGVKSHIEDEDIIKDILLYADYIQIRNEEIQNFYEELVRLFFVKDFKWDLQKIQLNSISDAQYHISGALLKSLGIQAEIICTNRFSLQIDPKNKPYRKDEIQTKDKKYVNFNQTSHMDEGETFKLYVLLCLLNVQSISIRQIPQAYNFIHHEVYPSKSDDEIDVGKLYYECENIFLGKHLIHNCLPFLIEKLKELCMETTINGTFEMIRRIPLDTLHLHHFIENSCDSQVDCLWEEGVLRETLRNLIICDDKYRETAYVTFRSGQGKPTFPPICNLKLTTLGVTYEGHDTDDFSLFHDRPVTKTLKALTVRLIGKSQHFLTFISPIELKRFDCKIYDDNEVNFDAFFSADQRKHLRTLKMAIFQPGFTFTEKTLHGLGMLNLIELRISISKGTKCFGPIFKLRNLQKTLTHLWLNGAPVSNDDLKELENFEKIEHLDLEYDSNLSETSLSDWLRQLRPVSMFFGRVPRSYAPDELMKLERLESIFHSKFKQGIYKQPREEDT